VLGLDPDPSSLWPEAHAAVQAGMSPAEAASAAVLHHCRALIDATSESCVAIKPQLARFEVLGASGHSVLAQVMGHARAHGLLVIADGKRGDIDVTAGAYANSLFGGLDGPFGHIDGLQADLITVNPLMGRDAIAPFVEVARAAGAGVLILVRTSNPGAADLEDLRLEGGEALWERIALMVAELGRSGLGSQGLSDVGAVMGATVPAHLDRARELMGSTPLLLPGIGAQGGRVEDLRAAFLPGRGGGLVTASRSIAAAHVSAGGEPAQAASAEAARLRAVAWSLSGSVLAES